MQPFNDSSSKHSQTGSSVSLSISVSLSDVLPEVSDEVDVLPELDVLPEVEVPEVVLPLPEAASEVEGLPVSVVVVSVRDVEESPELMRIPETPSVSLGLGPAWLHEVSRRRVVERIASCGVIGTLVWLDDSTCAGQRLGSSHFRPII